MIATEYTYDDFRRFMALGQMRSAANRVKNDEKGMILLREIEAILDAAPKDEHSFEYGQYFFNQVIPAVQRHNSYIAGLYEQIINEN